MLTTAITAGLAAILTFFGVEPGLYIGPMWIAVKVLIVGTIGGVMWWRDKKKRERHPLEEGAARVEQTKKD